MYYQLPIKFFSTKKKNTNVQKMKKHCVFRQLNYIYIYRERERERERENIYIEIKISFLKIR